MTRVSGSINMYLKLGRRLPNAINLSRLTIGNLYASFYPLLNLIIFEWQQFVFVKIISILNEELFSETYGGCTASYFVYIL